MTRTLLEPVCDAQETARGSAQGRSLLCHRGDEFIGDKFIHEITLLHRAAI
jgi:hypothetical protein